MLDSKLMKSPTRYVKSLFTLILLFSTFAIFAQKKNDSRIEVTGLVTDFEGKPVKKVAIFVDSMRTQIKTNRKGRFKMRIKIGTESIMAFSPNYGFVHQDYTNKKECNFVFPEILEPLTETDLIDLGYGITVHKDLAIKSVQSEKNIDYSTYSDIFQLIRERLPGVQVVGEKIIIRGNDSATTGDGSPLILVNGNSVGDISNISPALIKSITVLKGSDTSFYGARGANGVLLIKI